ncbi:hypothetical protein FF011L_00170 [Roseimaritima multifibrata]|uniref:Uncharacterized protein n=1 Tax=Roseimaritima multifibrata TaxID=1930274 RepID=A0A517M8S7_9BACT|nr:hypothetical protein FF011L_00170 [Roseimaritima multifibrata]
MFPEKDYSVALLPHCTVKMTTIFEIQRSLLNYTPLNRTLRRRGLP